MEVRAPPLVHLEKTPDLSFPEGRTVMTRAIQVLIHVL